MPPQRRRQRSEANKAEEAVSMRTLIKQRKICLPQPEPVDYLIIPTIFAESGAVPENRDNAMGQSDGLSDTTSQARSYMLSTQESNEEAQESATAAMEDSTVTPDTTKLAATNFTFVTLTKVDEARIHDESEIYVSARCSPVKDDSIPDASLGRSSNDPTQHTPDSPTPVDASENVYGCSTAKRPSTQEESQEANQFVRNMHEIDRIAASKTISPLGSTIARSLLDQTAYVEVGDAEHNLTASPCAEISQLTNYSTQLQTDKTPLEIMSPIQEEQAKVQTLDNSPSETYLEDGTVDHLVSTSSRLSVSSDGSTVVSEGRSCMQTHRKNLRRQSRGSSRVLVSQIYSPVTGPTAQRNTWRGPQLPNPTRPMPQPETTVSSFTTDVIYTNSHSRPVPGQLTSNLLRMDPSFSYNQPHDMTNCWLPYCSAPTSSMDGHTVICPRCGPTSYIRYCSREHLHADVKRHYIQDCAKRQNLMPYVFEDGMDPVNASTRHFVDVNNEIHDSFERHRQAIYHSYPADTQSDYYIFNEYDRIVAGESHYASITKEILTKYRGTGRVFATVRFAPNDPVKQSFAKLLARQLALGTAAGFNAGACGLFFGWMKENLRSRELWDEDMITRACLAMQMEFGWRVPASMY